jgi:soluble lytic murein transglycosylase-like protein
MKWRILITIIVGVAVFKLLPTNPTTIQESSVSEVYLQQAPASVQLYYYIKRYAAEYNIPESYAFAIAFQETGYRGPLHFNYRANQTSFAGAKGAMQIMPATAQFIQGKKISDQKLLHDIELNVKISMKLLSRLKRIYKDWGLVFGAYNTGRPCINEYARKVLNRNYHWIKSI